MSLKRLLQTEPYGSLWDQPLWLYEKAPLLVQIGGSEEKESTGLTSEKITRRFVMQGSFIPPTWLGLSIPEAFQGRILQSLELVPQSSEEDNATILTFPISLSVPSFKPDTTRLLALGLYGHETTLLTEMEPLYGSVFETGLHVTPRSIWDQQNLHPPQGGMVGTEKIQFDPILTNPVFHPISLHHWILSGGLSLNHQGCQYVSKQGTKTGWILDVVFQKQEN
jgi:hypothetical protein